MYFLVISCGEFLLVSSQGEKNGGFSHFSLSQFWSYYIYIYIYIFGRRNASIIVISGFKKIVAVMF